METEEAMRAMGAHRMCSEQGLRPGETGASALIHDLREALAAAGDPARAEQERAYLKSTMPMHGVGVPKTRKIAQSVAAGYPDLWREAATWEAALRELWDGATHREERNAALAIVRSKHSAPHAARMESLALYEHFLRTGQWWDLVDETSHAVGLVVRAHPAAAARMRAWREETTHAADTDELMGIEGAASAAYFDALAMCAPPTIDFNGRSRRPPLDVPNAALSYAYAISAGRMRRRTARRRPGALTRRPARTNRQAPQPGPGPHGRVPAPTGRPNRHGTAAHAPTPLRTRHPRPPG